MNNKKYTAAVIGLGNIGMGYDYSCADDRRIISHSSAYSHHSGYTLIAAVDPDIEKRTLFTKKYGAPAYASIDEMCLETRAEIYSIAAPTDQHYALFSQLLAYQPRAILCEKPMSDSLEKAKKMRAMAEQEKVILFVNYMRRFEPGVKNMASLLEQGSLGKINKVVIKYSNGFLNCATHFLDLVQYLFGPVDFIRRIGSEKDCNLNGNIDVYCKISDIDLFFIATGPCDYSLHELEIIGEKGVLRYKDAGHDIQYQLSSLDSTIEGAITLNNTPVSCPNDFDRFQWHVLDALYQSLKGAPRLANVDAAVDVLKLVSMALN